MDAIDRIIVANSPQRARHILILDAPGLLEAAQHRADKVSIWCDDVRDAEQVPAELLIEHFAEALVDVDLVWLRLPKSLGALEEYAELVSYWAAENVTLVAAERNKYLNHAMNPILERCFDEVHASLGQEKCRALIASGTKKTEPSFPRHKIVDTPAGEVDLWWHGATFAAGRIDDGTKVLLPHLVANFPALTSSEISASEKQPVESRHESESVPGSLPQSPVFVDLGCGSGIISACLSRIPGATVHALDISAAAIDATLHTCSGKDVVTHWGTDLNHLAPGSVDIVVTNPPFHRGTAKDSTPTIELFRQAARLLKPGGEIWCVFNSHLPWASHLNQLVGPTYEVERQHGYVVTRTVRAG